MRKNEIATHYGDVVQINPDKDAELGGCFVFVDKIEDDGIEGFIKIPGSDDKIRVIKQWDEIEWCGQATWRSDSDIKNDKHVD